MSAELDPGPADGPSTTTDQPASDEVGQALSDADRSASRSDRTSADSDQRASDRDQAAADRDHAAGTDLTAADERAYDMSREQREAATADRLGNQVERATTARERDLTGRYRAVLDVGPHGVVAINASGRIIFLNEPLARMFGYALPELLDQPLECLLPERSRLGHVGNRVGFMADPGPRQMAVDHEVAGRRKDGSEFPVEVALSPIDSDHGIQVFATIVDVTARKASESRQLHAQKLESVGRLTGGIAHDFNNMLSAIRGYAELLARDLDPERRGDLDPDDALACIREITRAADRASTLTAGLLAFSRHQVVAPTPVDLDAAIVALAPMLRQLVAPAVDIQLSLGAAPGHILADPGWIDQIVMNLVVNARDAMPDGGMVRIETSRVDGAPTRAVARPTMADGPCVAMSVIDTGIGMDEATQARIFEPFFTTKPIGTGTGLGLATTLGIVSQAGGHISLVSKPGHGSTFTLTFPLVDALILSTLAPPTHRAAGTGRVLVVDDEAAVRDVTTRLLRIGGWDVVAVADGASALEAMAGAGRFDVVVAEVVMAGLSGLTLAERVLDAHPDCGVILTSGYVETALALAPLLARGVTFLSKPASSSRLLDAVEHASSGSATTPVNGDLARSPT